MLVVSTPGSKDCPVKRASRQALAAARAVIERDFAPPTEGQARVTGMESVVDGVEWALSTKQLQVC